MPASDPVNLKEKVRALPDENLTRIPALVLSANATESDRLRSHQVGFARHLDKPISAADLVQSVAEVLQA